MDGPARRENGDDAIFLEIDLSENTIRALVDTGASDCFISKATRNQLSNEQIIDTWKVDEGQIQLANNSNIHILEQLRIKFKLAGTTVCYDFNVVDNLCHQMVIGRNFLAAVRADMSFPGPHCEVFGGNPITVAHEIDVPANSEMIIPVKPKHVTSGEKQGVYCEPAATAMVMVEACVNLPEQTWWIKVMNPQEEAIRINPGDVLAYASEAAIPQVDDSNIPEFLDLTYLEQTDVPIALGRVAGETVNEMVQLFSLEKSTQVETEEEIEEKISNIDLSQSCLNDEEKTWFRKMLKRNRSSLAFTMAELGECKLIPMVIKVDETEGVVSSRPYRYSPQKMDIIDEQVKQLLDVGVIEPSESAWRSPLVVVQKKDGKPRLCTDFRMLNMITRKDKFPMPTARSLFLYMAYKKPTMWSALDLLSGYHQCSIEHYSRKYTAFETPMGVYQYRRVPFGLIGAPWHFTKVMAIALRGLIPRVCLAYLDDVIVYDTSFEEHVRSVEMVLVALCNAGLKLKPSKCEWCRDEIKFLGHVVNAKGVQTQQETVRKVQSFNRPHNQKTVKSFLGLCNYYRSFVPNFAKIAGPLYKLLKKDIEFKWTDACEDSFEVLKEALTSAPLLIHPDIGGHFHVLSDASDTACGAAVCHQMNGLYRPVAYWGTTLRDAELNYTVTEKEALAVIKCLKEYEDMLQGAKVTIVTDHKPLIPLLQSAYKAPSARLKRWALALTDFDYEIQYEPGATHFLPDFLSRVQSVIHEDPEYEPEVGCELFAMELRQEELTTSQIIVEQNRDPECRQLIDYLEQGVLPSGELEARKVINQAESMSMEEPGVLCKVSRTNYKGENPVSRFKYRMVIPKTLVKRVLSLLHEDVFAGGHVGVNALQAKVIDKFYWGRMQSDILSYVRACERCSLRKRAPRYKAEAKSWDTPSRPWQVVQCDFIGPLKKASNGARYIMTFIDLLTGWPEAFCTKDSTAPTAAEVFLYQIVCRYGRVERLHTDRGATFLSDLFREITTRVACRQTFTTGGMPTGNARVERMHKTLETIIGCYISNGHENWPDLVPIALWTIRSTTSVRTGFSPYTLTFGRDPVSMGLPEGGNAPESLNDHEWFMQTRDNLALFRHIAKDVVAKYERGMRDKLDEHARPTQFLEGDLVYMYDPTAAENMVSKFSNVYRGPYRVVEVRDDHLVRISSLATGKKVPHYVNIQKIKRAYGPWSPALTKTHTKPSPTNTEVSDQSRRFHAQTETADVEFSVVGAKTESRVDPPAPLDMESPQIHGGPIINHETSPGGQITGQKYNSLTGHNQQTTGETHSGQSGKKTKKRRTKKAVTDKPSQETEVTPVDSLNDGKKTKLKGKKLTSEENVPISHPHVQEAGRTWTTEDGLGQRVPGRYNLRNASAPVSYARFFDEMEEEEW